MDHKGTHMTSCSDIIRHWSLAPWPSISATVKLVGSGYEINDGDFNEERNKERVTFNILPTLKKLRQFLSSSNSSWFWTLHMKSGSNYCCNINNDEIKVVHRKPLRNHNLFKFFICSELLSPFTSFFTLIPVNVSLALPFDCPNLVPRPSKAEHFSYKVESGYGIFHSAETGNDVINIHRK